MLYKQMHEIQHRRASLRKHGIRSWQPRLPALSLEQEPILRPSQTTQLVSTYRPTVQIMRQFFDILWSESTPFALREAILLGHPLSESGSRITRGREEAFLQTAAALGSAKESIRVYIPTRYGPARLLKGQSEPFLCAHRRARIRVICRLSEDNAGEVKTIAKFAEVRCTDNSMGFSIGIVDNLDAAIYYTEPDSPVLESRADYTIRITSRQGIRHLGNLFEALWQESAPIEELLQMSEEPRHEPTNPSS